MGCLFLASSRDGKGAEKEPKVVEIIINKQFERLLNLRVIPDNVVMRRRNEILPNILNPKLVAQIKIELC